MKKSFSREIKDSIRQQAISIMKDSAKADNLSLHGDNLALLSFPDSGLFVNAPIEGIEKLDFKTMFDGHPVLNNIPIMYWYLSDTILDEKKSPISSGFYTVFANSTNGTTSLRDSNGKTIAHGDLTINISSNPKIVAKPSLFGVSVSGGIDSFKRTKNGIKVCGHVTVSAGPADITVSGCIEVKN